jgi:hypothetical protein
MIFSQSASVSRGLSQKLLKVQTAEVHIAHVTSSERRKHNE